MIKQAHIDTVVMYVLRPRQQPTNPSKVWHGRVKKYFVDHRGILDCVLVESLEAGYEGDTEYVYPSQIVGLEAVNALHQLW